eukprot:CAMPEP_0194271156 /NCGR_PEP_ID=MMETSP0169-20130528/5015_1 /TAXON_ID=218684 /ORGANISM="Corethron pennatum, Strain L29A3" /LENGTH=559 /DNA_ID=CAMNT_0039013441 /DNA_START=61 /DNA_END=1737 /DNA_ORIENTATION=+
MVTMDDQPDAEDDYTSLDYTIFANYIPTTRNPGRFFFIATSIYVAFIIFAIGPVVYFGKKWKKYCKEQKKGESWISSWNPLKKKQRKIDGAEYPTTFDDTDSTLGESLLDSVETPLSYYDEKVNKNTLQEEASDAKFPIRFDDTISTPCESLLDSVQTPLSHNCLQDEVPEDVFKMSHSANILVEKKDENKNTQGNSNEEGQYLENNFNETAWITLLVNRITEKITQTFQTLRRVVKFDEESRKILKISVPSTFSTISESLLDAIVTAMVSAEIGANAYIAYTMVSLFLDITDTFIGGIKDAESVLTAQAVGMENYFLAGQYFQLSTIIYIIIAIPSYGMWVFIAEWTLFKLNMGEEIAQIGGGYIRIAVVSQFVNGIAGAFSILLWSADYGVLATTIDTIFHVLYVLSLGILFYVFDMKDLVYVAWIDVVYGVLYGAFIFCFVYFKGTLDLYWKGMFLNCALKKGELVHGLLKMSVPLTLDSIMSYGEWGFFTFFSTTMGRAEVVVWSLGGAIWAMFETLPNGLGDAAELRVAFHLGKGCPDRAKNVAYKVLLYAVVW